MNDVTRKKAEYLFDELGLIDDAIIAEADRYVSGKKDTLTIISRLTAVAAAALVVVAISVGAVVVTRYGELSSDKAGDKGDNVNEYTAMVDISDSLIRAESSERTESYASAEDIELFDGVTKIIWKSFVSENYYVIPLHGISENSSLDHALRKTYDSNESVSLGSVESVKLWISYGDGSVISPYLRESAGNVGYGELFDYSSEIVPSEKLGEFIDDLIE